MALAFARRALLAPGGISSPLQIPGLQLWLDASQLIGFVDGDPVGTWPDLSGKGRNFTQGTGAAKPTYKAGIQAGKPIVRFDSVDDTLLSAATFANVALASQWTWFFAGKWNAQRNFSHDSGNKFVLRGGGSSFYFITYNGVTYDDQFSSPYTNGKPVVCSYLHGGGVYTISLNGVPGTPVSAPDPSALTGTLELGAYPSAYMDGDLYEAIYYNRALSNSERRSAERYLRAKWGDWVMAGFTRRLIIVARADVAAKANTAAFQPDTDPEGGDKTFTVGLSADGNPPAVASWCSWQMKPTTAAAIRSRLRDQGATVAETTPVPDKGTPASNRFAVFDVDDGWTPDKVLATIGLQRVVLPERTP